MINYFSDISILFGNMFYTVGKPDHSPFKWRHTCKEHGPPELAAQLGLQAPPPQMSQIFKTAAVAVAIDLAFDGLDY